MKIDMLASFSVNKVESIEDAAKVFKPYLKTSEEIVLAFQHRRDKVVFTNDKIICMDVQGLTGSKKEFRFFPYSKISSFSVESAGVFDGDGDFKIWVSGVGVFEIKFGLKLNVQDVAKYLIDKVG